MQLVYVDRLTKLEEWITFLSLFESENKEAVITDGDTQDSLESMDNSNTILENEDNKFCAILPSVSSKFYTYDIRIVTNSARKRKTKDKSSAKSEEINLPVSLGSSGIAPNLGQNDDDRLIQNVSAIQLQSEQNSKNDEQCTSHDSAVISNTTMPEVTTNSTTNTKVVRKNRKTKTVNENQLNRPLT